jgi:hypothetical protein
VSIIRKKYNKDQPLVLSKILELDVEGEEWGDLEEDTDLMKLTLHMIKRMMKIMLKTKNFLTKSPIILCMLWMKVLKITHL